MNRQVVVLVEEGFPSPAPITITNHHHPDMLPFWLGAPVAAEDSAPRGVRCYTAQNLLFQMEPTVSSEQVKPVRTAIVTGASRGIGRAIAVGLGGAGFNVVVNYNSNRDAAEECGQAIVAAGGKYALVQGDVGKAEDRARILGAAADAFGSFDTLVNNAGVAPKVRADLLETSEESFDYLLDTNLKGPYFLSQAAAKLMIGNLARFPQGIVPSIINVSSISAYTASVNRGEYCVSKAGIAMMTQLFAVRLAEYGINVYEVRPGIIATDMTGPVKAKYDKLILEDGLLPIKRWGQPQDIGKAVAAIASGCFPYSTGEVFNVDGGFHLRRL